MAATLHGQALAAPSGNRKKSNLDRFDCQSPLRGSKVPPNLAPLDGRKIKESQALLMTWRVGSLRRPLKPKAGLNGPLKAFVAGAESFFSQFAPGKSATRETMTFADPAQSFPTPASFPR